MRKIYLAQHAQTTAQSKKAGTTGAEKATKSGEFRAACRENAALADVESGNEHPAKDRTDIAQTRRANARQQRDARRQPPERPARPYAGERVRRRPTPARMSPNIARNLEPYGGMLVANDTH